MKVEELQDNDHIKVVSLKTSKKDGSMYSTSVTGRFRGRVNRDEGNFGFEFSSEGKEIWLVTDTGMSAFFSVAEILNVSKV
jgi:hypothetical protein